MDTTEMKCISVSALVLLAILVFAGAPAKASSPLIISELQSTGCREYQAHNPNVCAADEGSQEFVELYNQAETDLDISGWRLEYFSAGNAGAGAPTRVLAEFHGKARAKTHVLVSSTGYLQNADSYFGSGSSGYLAKSGGHIRLVDGNGTVIDLLSWGSALSFNDWPKVPELKGGELAKRLFPGDPLYSPALPFVITTTPTPQAGGLEPFVCEGAVLSEIMPNPVGADSSQEFIELYNPTDAPIHLAGCSLRVGEGAAFVFGNQTLEPGQYRALSDAELGFSLPNSAGGTVWLITSGAEQGIQYPGNMKEGHAWAFDGSVWKVTTTPTKGQVNVLTSEEIDGGKGSGTPLPCPAGKYRHPETNRCRSLEAPNTSLKPCRPDQERNPETNRCRQKATSVSLASCKPGQVRNPESNRCRSVSTASTSLTPCKPGQERNPATNRCRSTTSASASLKPCAPGQERNPATNRCRKMRSHDEAAAYGVEKTSAPPAAIGWLVAGATGVTVAGYGAYEWRREIGSFLTRLKDKISGGPP